MREYVAYKASLRGPCVLATFDLEAADVSRLQEEIERRYPAAKMTYLRSDDANWENSIISTYA